VIRDGTSGNGREGKKLPKNVSGGGRTDPVEGRQEMNHR
jgi:hypothetical protein